MRLRLCPTLVLFAAGGAASAQFSPPSLNKPPVLGDVKFGPGEQAAWGKLMDGLKRPEPRVILQVQKTAWQNLGSAFPPSDASKYVNRSPTAPVSFLMRLQDVPPNAPRILLQIASQPSAASSLPPFAGWEKPAGLLSEEIIAAPVRTTPAAADDAKFLQAIPIPYADPAATGFLQVTAGARYCNFEAVLPKAAQAKAGESFYVRAIPVSERGSARTPLAPPSNWVHFLVDGTAAEQVQAGADKVFKTKQFDAEAKGQTLAKDAESARKAIQAAYEVRLLSYIPPKFTDDADAAQYFICRTGAAVGYDRGKVTNLSLGETYYLPYVANLIKSDKKWSQELWEVLSASLNQTSGTFAAAKLGLVNSLADGLEKVTGAKISPAARAAMLQGLNFALAYCGIPPTLPNIDELYSRGTDYLAATIVDMAIEQATGVAISDAGLNPMATMATAEAMRGPAQSAMKDFIGQLGKPAPFDAAIPETWGTPAPYFRRRPAMAYIEIRRKPGGKPVANAAWQSMEIKFQKEILPTGPIALPRTPGERLIVPVALSTVRTNWKIAGYMPDSESAAGSGVGQPYYQAVGDSTLTLATRHRLGADVDFGIFWPISSIKLDTVNARELPDKLVLTPAESAAGLNGPIKLAPANYIGKHRLRWFRTP